MNIQKFRKGNKTYYVAVRQARVNGKPRIVWRKYLGTADRIVKVFEQRYLSQIKFKAFEFGKTAALLALAEELDFVDVVNDAVEKRDTNGLSVGEWLLLILLGRCHGPYSKQGTGEQWFQKSFLSLIWETPHKLNSQNFLNQMAYLDKERIERITMAIGQKLVSMGIKVSQLMWDTTNFSTNIESWGENSLFQTGFAKDKRYDKNLVGLGIAVSDDNIPLYHHTYPGNVNDSVLFRQIIDSMIEKLSELKLDVEELALTLDCGSVSEENIKAIVDRIHVIGALKRNQVSDLLSVPVSEFKFVYRSNQKNTIKAYRTERELFGRKFTVIITYNPATERKQRLTYEQSKREILEEFKSLAERYARKNGKGRKMSMKGLINELQELIPKQLRSIFWYRIDEKNRTLEYGVEDTKEKELYLSFGKKPLFTDLSWSTKKIVKAYHRKSMVEEDFKWLKGKLLVPIPPFFVRKEQMVRVHIFLCILGMLFIRRLKMKFPELKLSAVQLMKELENLKVALMKDIRTGEIALHIETMNPIQARVFSELKLERYLVLK